MSWPQVCASFIIHFFLSLDISLLGKNCERIKGPCERDTPCNNGGQCENNADNFICHCPIGYNGQLCNTQQQFTDYSTARFNGQSFISFDNSYLTRNNQRISFMIKTFEDNGLLLYWGQTNGNGKDFLLLLITNGTVGMTFELGSGIGIVDTTLPVNDGSAHLVLVELFEQTGIVEVDGKPFTGHSPGELKILNANSDIYFGGKPDYIAGFSGCISRIILADAEITDLRSQTTQSRNVAPCDDF